MDVDALRSWLSVLDQLSYYDLFRVPQSAEADDLRRAFHEFAEIFHPDAHAWRAQNEREMVTHIFRRGAEAYRVLSEPNLRIRYDRYLASGVVRPDEVT